MRFWCGLIVLVLLALAGTVDRAQAAVTPEQRAKVQQMTELMREAGELYASNSYVDSATKISELQQQLLELMQDGGQDPALQRLVRPIYRRLSNAHSMLELEGAELQPLPAWQELVEGMPEEEPADEPTAGGVSFRNDIAPWFVSACGNCHITNRRGQFSMASFEDLMKGPPEGKVIFPGSDTGNRLVEVIESGDMPRGGGTVTPEQLTALKKWIAEGARFDGPNPTAALPSYVERRQANAPPPITPSAATGQETVSFSRDIAPVLMENCKGCHINGRQASGNLRMDNFEQLLRGGDSGNVLAKNSPADSLIVKKLRGTGGGQRMPVGRPALPEETIQMIETWIREGATFDGPSPNTNIEVVVNRAWAAEATHEELLARRMQRASQNWSRALPTAKPTMVEGAGGLVVMGNAPPARMEEITAGLKQAFQKVGKQFGAPNAQPLIRGGLAVFVLKNRYDYSELGRMIETRELPKDWLGHWRSDPLDVYAVINAGDELTDELLDSVTLQVTSGAYLASLGEVPFWFAEGVARNVVMSHHRRDTRVKQWQASLPAAGQQVENAAALLNGRLDEEAAGTIGMALTNFMMNRSNRRRFDRLIDLLQEGKSFDESLTFTYAPPETLVKSWLGK